MTSIAFGGSGEPPLPIYSQRGLFWGFVLGLGLRLFRGYSEVRALSPSSRIKSTIIFYFLEVSEGRQPRMTRMDGNDSPPPRLRRGRHGWTGMTKFECRICAIRDIRGSPNSSCLLVSIRGLFIILLRELCSEVLKNLKNLYAELRRFAPIP